MKKITLCPFSPLSKCFAILRKNGDCHWVQVDADFELGPMAWTVQVRENGRIHHVRRNKKLENGKKTSELLHHVVFGDPPPGKVIDHIDTNPLNNTRKNLRLCLQAENCRNSKKSTNNKSGFKGVSYHKKAKKFAAYIMVNRKKIHLGLFETAEEAHDAYCLAAEKMHKEYARVE